MLSTERHSFAARSPLDPANQKTDAFGVYRQSQIHQAHSEFQERLVM